MIQTNKAGSFCGSHLAELNRVMRVCVQNNIGTQPTLFTLVRPLRWWRSAAKPQEVRPNKTNHDNKLSFDRKLNFSWLLQSSADQIHKNLKWKWRRTNYLQLLCWSNTHRRCTVFCFFFFFLTFFHLKSWLGVNSWLVGGLTMQRRDIKWEWGQRKREQERLLRPKIQGKSFVIYSLSVH